MKKIGIIGGSGLYQLDGITNVEEVNVPDTPFGQPSDKFITGELDGVEIVFLARHGKGHHISPSTINYRANIFEMKRMGVHAIISVSACGSLKEELVPRDFVVPDQFIDRTCRTREASFFTDGIVAHVSLANPVSPELSKILVESGRESGATMHDGGTYINMEGPQFSTKAESNLYRSWGAAIIGMTNMVEAKLAREAEIAYASLSAVTDYDCWREGHDDVTVDMIIKNLTANVDKAKEILKLAIPKAARVEKYVDEDALKYALITDPTVIPEQKKKELEVLIGKYVQVNV